MIAFDKETCSDFETALSKEWLETNGLGGFASSSLASCNTRRYHGLLVAATQPPVGRMMLVNGLEEWIEFEGKRYDLSCHQYAGAVHPEGHLNLIGFRLDPWPVWTYRAGSLVLEKAVTMMHGQNTTVVTYRLKKAAKGATLILRPMLTGRSFHDLHHENSALRSEAVSMHAGVCQFTPYEGVPSLYIHHNAARYDAGFGWFRQLEYVREHERGMEDHEDCWAPGSFQFSLGAEQDSVFIATTEGGGYVDARVLLAEERARRKGLLAGWEASDDVTRQLILAADQFVVRRNFPEGATPKSGKSIVAGYPWFEDWGRDTFIALPGLLLTTNRFQDARDILSAYARFTRHGMVPNRFPDASNEPEYNSVDASLWYIVAIFQYLRYTGDFQFVGATLWPTMREIMDAYQEGTRFGIHMDVDGLLHAGQNGLQLTWMDAKIGDWVVTPRTGKPVEVQALWYNALRIMDQVSAQLGDTQDARRWSSMSEKVWAAINRQFWFDEGGYLYDVVDGDVRDASIRPNQILAVSLPFESVTPDRAGKIVALIEDRLLTPFGLRTLDPRDPRYVSLYSGDFRSRDSAYHQGTVWPWLMGPFLTAYQKVNGRSANVQAHVRAHLALLLTHLWESGLGTISEIFDADIPHDPRGCYAQAWSVGEVLRVLREELGPPVSPAGKQSQNQLKSHLLK